VGAAVDRDRRLVQLLPGELEPIALEHRDGLVIGGPHGYQAKLGEGGGHAFPADDKHPRAGPEPVQHEVGAGLRRGHHVGRRRRNVELDKVSGDRIRGSRRVVGDETDPGSPLA
jgi:hypothetical protein